MPGILRLSTTLFLLLSSFAVAWAGTPPSTDQTFRLKAMRDDAGLTLVWTIGPGSYLYRGMLVAKDATAPGTPITIRTPPGEPKDDPDFGRQEIYRDKLEARIASADLQGRHEIVLTYQGCAEAYQICYPPVVKTLDLQTLAVRNREGDEAGSSRAASSFVDAPQDLPGGAGQDPPTGGSQGSEWDLSYSVSLGGMLASFFGFGVLLSLSPCTFPLVPIFFGLLTRTQERPSLYRGLTLAITFVGASAFAYAVLGAFAAWSGSGTNLQIMLQTPIALGVMSTVLVALSLSMFGLFEIQLPAGFIDRISGAAGSRGPLAAAAVLGFSSALIAGPCVTPPLATALLYVARTGNVARGMTALFLFGVGMGVPLLVFGALGPRFLPKPGPWHVRVRHAFGFILLGVAISIFSRVLSQQTTFQLWGALAIGIAVYLGTQYLTSHTSWRFASMGFALLALLTGSVLLLGSAGDDSVNATAILGRFVTLQSEPSVTTVRAITALDQELAAARTAGKPVMLDFSAEWCVECRLMDAVLRKPEVRERLQEFRMVRADVTAVDAASRALMQRFEIVGPPTILLFRAKESGDPATKIVGAVDADALLAKLSTVISAD
jgi:thioredoxin:protein disulfide reductase